MEHEPQGHAATVAAMIDARMITPPIKPELAPRCPADFGLICVEFVACTSPPRLHSLSELTSAALMKTYGIPPVPGVEYEMAIPPPEATEKVRQDSTLCCQIVSVNIGWIVKRQRGLGTYSMRGVWAGQPEEGMEKPPSDSGLPRYTISTTLISAGYTLTLVRMAKAGPRRIATSLAELPIIVARASWKLVPLNAVELVMRACRIVFSRVIRLYVVVLA